ncbi:MAG: hypothetical protein RML35_07805 [Chloroherpetonaceae bacterium]|nr:hypothetical protein [Chloroherpetonaceae bacterium]
MKLEAFSCWGEINLEVCFKHGVIERIADSMTNPTFAKLGKYSIGFNITADRNENFFFHTAIPFECFRLTPARKAERLLKEVPNPLTD